MLSRCLLAVVPLFVLAMVAVGQTPQLVDVGGHRLEVLRAGSGGPPVIFESGLGDTFDAWAKIWPLAARFSTVVAYSRSGLGKSELGPRDHRAKSAVSELRDLLTRLQLKPPYVLVGRSYGGILVRLYTSLYPADVAGLVIVEGSHEQQVRRWGMLDPTYPAAFRDSFEAKLRELKPGAEADETLESLRIQEAGSLEGMKALPDIPIAVLTSMKVDPAAKFVNQTAQGHEAWRAMHEEWFRRSRNGLHIVTTRSGHQIQLEEPELVLQGIQFVLSRIRTK
jgi:pimeloyl-ACP methyl ester carboxylesterase